MVHMSIATNATASRHAGLWASIQSDTAFAVRPSTWPSSPAPPAGRRSRRATGRPPPPSRPSASFQPELRLPAPGLVDARAAPPPGHLRQHALLGLRVERAAPPARTPRGPGRTGYGPPAVGDRRPGRGAQPARQPGPRRDLRQRLGERPPRAPSSGTASVAWSTSARCAGRPPADPGAWCVPSRADAPTGTPHPGQHRACSSAVTSASIGVVRIEPDTSDLHPVQPEQARRIVDQARGLPSILQVSATRMITERHGPQSIVKTLIHAFVGTMMKPSVHSSCSRSSRAASSGSVAAATYSCHAHWGSPADRAQRCRLGWRDRSRPHCYSLSVAPPMSASCATCAVRADEALSTSVRAGCTQATGW